MKTDYTPRELSQLIRRKMITKIKPSGKVYDRNKSKRCFAE